MAGEVDGVRLKVVWVPDQARTWVLASVAVVGARSTVVMTGAVLPMVTVLEVTGAPVVSPSSGVMTQ